MTADIFPYHRVCNKGNMTGAIYETAIAYPSGVPEIAPCV